MAVVTKRLFKAVSSVTLGSYYSVPVNATTMVKAVTLCNITSAAVTFRLRFGGSYVIFDHQINANDTVTIPFLDQILTSGESIEMSCSANNAISVYISGKEVT
ncbi:hypothetical protein MKX75_06100 [Paenibacillus sp. FSL R5-0341]|uniref:hypothetical protein n=1 Tax=Paenibacillus sp. FSL R5-0341 TaxID=2921636 RepID=UPI0030D4BA4C